MSANTKIETISDVKVFYSKFEGMVDNRYEMAFLVNGEWKTHTLIATEGDREYRMAEIIEMYKNLSGR